MPKHSRGEAPLFVSWVDGSPLPNTAATSGEFIQRASGSQIFRGIEPNISVRDGMNRRDYEYFRPEESVAHNIRDIILQARYVYKRIGLVHNVIDLMADFGCQGIEIVHPVKKVERFLQAWGKMVGLKERSERFLNLLYRTGNVIMERTTAKLKLKELKTLQKGVALGEPDITLPEQYKLERNEIPYSYRFRNPLSLEIMGGEELAVFTGSFQYVLRIPNTLSNKIKNPKTDEARMLINTLPQYIVDAVRAGKHFIPLDKNKLKIYHYKKDDDQAWAEPLTYSIMDDLVMLNKLKMADLAALDGAISHIRLWRLGSLDHKILPTDAAIGKLADILANSVGGGSMDLIWGPELDVKETSTEIYRFLGSEKYGPTLTAIYDGLGIPITLTSYSPPGRGGATNSYLSLKTLIERLQYGRNLLVNAWEDELKLIQQTFGYPQPAQLRFSMMTLADESSARALLIQLADRNVISYETIQERFGEIPELEFLRMNRENKARARGALPRKGGPWNNPEQTEALQKIALQTGVVTPGEVGLDLEEDTSDKVPAIELKAKQGGASPANDQKGQPQQGRPIGKKDTLKRKKKPVGPQTGVTNAFMWARAAQDKISEIVNPWFIAMCNKKNMRTLSDEEAKQVEDLKYTLLTNLPVGTEINEELLRNLIDKVGISTPDIVTKLYWATVSEFTGKFKREPTLDEVRQIQASVYALYRNTEGEVGYGES